MSGLIELSKPAARWLKVGSKRGVSSIEYGLLAALISLVIIGGAVKLGPNLNGVYQTIAPKLPAAVSNRADPEAARKGDMKRNRMDRGERQSQGRGENARRSGRSEREDSD